MRGPRNKVDSAASMIRPCSRRLAERAEIYCLQRAPRALPGTSQSDRSLQVCALRSLQCHIEGKKTKKTKLRAEQNGLLQGNRAGSPSSWTISAVVKFLSLTPYRSVKNKERRQGERGTRQRCEEGRRHSER